MTEKSGWLVEISHAVEPFEQEWHLLRRPDNSTPFQDFDLMQVFYRQLAANGLMQPVVALVRRPDGTAVALFPMMKTRRRGLTWLRMDASPLDHCGPLLETSLRQDEVRAIIGSVIAAVPSVDLLYCTKMPEHFEGRENPLVALGNAARLRLSAWQLQLAGATWKELVAKRQKRFKSKLSSRTKQLSASHDRRFEIRFGADVSAAEMTEFKALRASGFSEKDRTDILGDADWAGFYDGMLEKTGGTCQAFLATLKADGLMIAGLYGFVSGGRVEIVLPASLMGEWKDVLPGLQLFDETLGHFFHAQYRLYDFSIGDMVYKRRFGAEQVNMYDALFPASLAGRIYALAWRVKTAIRARMKPVVTE